MVVDFKFPHLWSNGETTYDVMRVNIHNFIEVEHVISISKNTRIFVIRRFLKLSTSFCAGFNKLKHVNRRQNHSSTQNAY